jgi:hypothetical protein
MDEENAAMARQPWNKGELVEQKTAFKPKEIWSIRVRLHMSERRRDLALFNLVIDSKLRACDLTALRVRDICHGDQVSTRAILLQRKAQRRSSSKLRPPPGKPYRREFARHTWVRMTTSSQASGIACITLARANTHGWSTAGLRT